MKHTRIVQVLAILLSFTVCAAAEAQRDIPVWKPLMDGKTLAGWHKNGLGSWTVEDGAFVGRSNNEKLYGHLVSNEEFEDFTVRFKFQCTSGDSGFFIRTEMKEPDKTHGMQVQVGPCGSGTGGIYESYGRGWLQKPTKEQETFCYRHDQWNEMVITARGPHVIVHVNGFKTSDIVDPEISQEAGVFALQMHSGVVNHTMFKDLAILEQGAVRPREFLYDAVETVEPAADGSLMLLAAAAMSVGPEILYNPTSAAFDSFTDKDHVYWPVNVKQAGTYDVWLEWSAGDDYADASFVLQLGDQQLTSKAASTGSDNNYEMTKVGTLQAQTGAQRVVLRPKGQFNGLLMNVRKVKLVKNNP